MKYSEASITAHYEGQEAETVDLEDVTNEHALVDHLWAVWFGDVPFGDEDDEAQADGMPERDSFAGNITFTDPQGFAVHLFRRPPQSLLTDEHVLVDNFGDILSAWSDESDDDRREAMGEYLDDMGADDLSDFEEAYRGQYADGAAFAEELAEQLGAVPTENTWICIDWDATWERNLRHDYHITDSGFVFRNM